MVFLRRGCYEPLLGMMHRLVNIVSGRKVARRLDDKLSSVFIADLTEISRPLKGDQYEEGWRRLREIILMRALICVLRCCSLRL